MLLPHSHMYQRVIHFAHKLPTVSMAVAVCHGAVCVPYITAVTVPEQASLSTWKWDINLSHQS